MSVGPLEWSHRVSAKAPGAGQATTTTASRTHENPALATRVELRHLDRHQWAEAVRSFADYNYRQTWPYGVALAKKRAAVSEHIAVQCNGELVGLADVRIKRIPLVGGGLAYVSGGPLIRKSGDSENDLERLELCLDALVREFVHVRRFTLRIAIPPDLPERNLAVTRCFERAGFKVCNRTDRYQTVLIDLERPLESLRSSLHGHWRRDLAAAERNGLKISFGTETDQFALAGAMVEALRARKGFDPGLDVAFFAEVQRELDDGDRLLVGLVFEGSEPVAASITAIHGDMAVYLFGATTDAGRRCRASYILQWRTIELLKKRGVRRYDLGGVDPIANPGVRRFKLRTGGIEITAPGPFEKSPDGFRARAAEWAERSYVWIRQVQTR